MKQIIGLFILLTSTTTSAAQKNTVDKLYEAGFLCSLERANAELSLILARENPNNTYYQEANIKALTAKSLCRSNSVNMPKTDTVSDLYEAGFLCSLEQANSDYAYKLAVENPNNNYYQQANQKALIAKSNCRNGSHYIAQE